MGYHVEAKDIPDTNAMPGLAQQQVNMLILLHFVRYFLVRYSELRFDQQGDTTTKVFLMLYTLSKSNATEWLV